MATGNSTDQSFQRASNLVPTVKSFKRTLLPYERELCAAIGCSVEEYEHYLAQLEQYSYIRPAAYDHIPDIQNGETAVAIIISLAIGLASTAASYFLTPKPRALSNDNQGGRTINAPGRRGQDRFLQSTSFDGYTDIAEFGDAIPIVWTRYTGTTGGVVVAPPLVWSRAFSLGNQQAVKLVYLIGEAGVSAVDIAGVFIGNTSLSVQQTSNYIFAWNGKYDYDASAITGESLGSGFSACLTPSNSTQFGVANPVPNCTEYRPNWKVISFPDGGDERTERDIKNERRKICGFALRSQGMKGVGRGYPRRQGVVSAGRGQLGNRYIISGDRLNTTPADFERSTSVTVEDINDSLDAECIATDAIMQVGEQFVVGEKLIKVVSRSEDSWEERKTVDITLSEPIPGGQEVAIHNNEYITNNKEPRSSNLAHFGTLYSSLCRAVIAAFRNNRRCEATEIGIKSQVWGRINGLAHFNAVPDPDTLVNYDNNKVQFNLGTISEYILRVSMFRVYYRPVTTPQSQWAQAGPILAIRGSTPTDQHHQIRVNHGADAEYEFEIRPVSSAVLTQGVTTLYVLNSKAPYVSVGPLQIKAELRNIFSNATTYEIDPFFEVRQMMNSGWGNKTGNDTNIIPKDIQYASMVAYNLNGNLITNGDLTQEKLYNAFLEELFELPSFRTSTTKTETLTKETDRGRVTFTLKVTSYPTTNLTVNGPPFAWKVTSETVNEVRVDNNENVFAPGQFFSYSQTVSTGNRHLQDINLSANNIDIRMRFKITTTTTQTVTPEDRGWRIFEGSTAFSEVSHYGSAITRSCDSGSEHEVVYVNQIGGTSLGSYQNITTAMLALKSNRNIGSVDQLRVWVKSGINNSNSFPALVRYLLQNTQGIAPQMIDNASFDAADSFCNANGLYYDGAITSRTNLRSFITSTAPFFLLNLVMRNGKIALIPALTSQSSSAMFTEGNIIEDSFTLEYLDVAERRPIKAEMIWRQNFLNEFPRNRSFAVGNGSSLETFDMSSFCTSQQHAEKAGKYICAVRQYITHSITFKTTLDNANVGPGSVITVALDQTATSRFSNGSIDSDGTIISTQNLPNGTYNITYFKSGNESIQEASLTVTNGRTSNSALFNSIFSIVEKLSYSSTYLVEQVELDEEGIVSISASEYPHNSIMSAIGNIVLQA